MFQNHNINWRRAVVLFELKSKLKAKKGNSVKIWWKQVPLSQYGLAPQVSEYLSISQECNVSISLIRKSSYCSQSIQQYGLWSFQTGGTKLERFLPKNQHSQRKFLDFENWTNGEPQQLAKIRVLKVEYFDFSCKKK